MGSAFLLSFFFLLISVNWIFSESQRVPAMFIFGDSLVDVGNNNHLSFSIDKANFPHNGIDYPGRKPTGRFCNGRNAADFIAQKLGISTSPPYLSLLSASNKSESFIQGVNFASGGAGILDGSSRYNGQCLPLNKQIEYYSEVYGELVQQLGNVESQIHISRSLFVVVIGSNDLIGYFKPASSLRSSKISPQQLVDLMILTLKGQMKRIYNLGARKIAVVGTGAIGCSPAQRFQSPTDDCNEEINHWSQKYNEGVQRILQELKSELLDLNYSFFNTYAILMEFIQNPKNYGFVEVSSACCGLGKLNAKLACLPISRYCSNREDHIFWDFYHPTEATARKLVDAAFDGSQEQYVYPVNIAQLLLL